MGGIVAFFNLQKRKRIMTPKQQLKSIEKKMERIQEINPEIDLKVVNKYFGDIERYNKLQREHFYLKFEIEHCPTCFKKI